MALVNWTSGAFKVGDRGMLNYKVLRFLVTQGYVHDLWVEYRVSDQSCIIKVELRSGDVKPLLLSNADRVHRYRTCDTAIRAVINTGWVQPIRVVPMTDK